MATPTGRPTARIAADSSWGRRIDDARHAGHRRDRSRHACGSRIAIGDARGTVAHGAEPGAGRAQHRVHRGVRPQRTRRGLTPYLAQYDIAPYTATDIAPAAVLDPANPPAGQVRRAVAAARSARCVRGGT